MKMVIKNKNIDQEIEIPNVIERELDCEFIIINPDEEDFNILKDINEIDRHIKKSTKKLTEKLTKNFLINVLSHKLLRLEFK